MDKDNLVPTHSLQLLTACVIKIEVLLLLMLLLLLFEYLTLPAAATAATLPLAGYWL